MERADIRAKQIDELNAWHELDEAEHDLQLGIREESVVCIVDGFNVEDNKGLLIQAA